MMLQGQDHRRSKLRTLHYEDRLMDVSTYELQVCHFDVDV